MYNTLNSRGVIVTLLLQVYRVHRCIQRVYFCVWALLQPSSQKSITFIPWASVKQLAPRSHVQQWYICTFPT